MLSYEELLSQIKQLPGPNRLALLEEIAHSLREEFPTKKIEDVGKVERNEGSKDFSLERLYGILKNKGIPQTDEGIRDDYTDYLAKKYALQKLCSIQILF